MANETGHFYLQAPPYIRDLTELLPQNSLVLDMGSGEGNNGNFIAQHGHRVVSVENDLDAAKNGHRILRAIGNAGIRNSFVSGDMLHPMFGDEQFDAVISTISLQHVTPIANAELALKKIMALTRPGGLNLVRVYIGDEQQRQMKSDRFSVFEPPQLETMYASENWTCVRKFKSPEPLKLDSNGGIQSVAQVIVRKPV